jgi:hypothetical protein
VCFFHKKFSQEHLRLFDPFTATSQLQIFHGYPTFKTATFLENSRGHGYLGTLERRKPSMAANAKFQGITKCATWHMDRMACVDNHASIL